MSDSAAPTEPRRGIVEMIVAKRDGGRLTAPEIRWAIDAYCAGELPQEQMAALAMAIYFQGLDPQESSAWTLAMLHSGTMLDLKELGPGRIDKHSTGGVGDKVSLMLAPAAAACGVIVPMVSGRGLGHTGGTIDKLESIGGYRADLDVAAFKRVLADVGCAIIGQTGDVAPADKHLYALRDVTGTVGSVPLIVSSIMSKKLAEDIEGLVIDVKVGSSAWMTTLDAGRELAEAMIAVGAEMGVKVIAFLTRMEEPLGRMVGNGCEVQEAVEVLRGGGAPELVELVTTLGGAMVEILEGVGHAEGKARVAASLADGSAFARFERMVAAQGGDLAALPVPTGETVVPAGSDGYVAAIDGLAIGTTGVMLGAGRQRSGDVIDPAIGIRIDAPRGSRVTAGQPLATIFHGAAGAPPADAIARVLAAFSIAETQPEPVSYVIERLG